MKILSRQNILILIANIFFSVCVTSCSTEESRAWSEATKANTCTSYSKFIDIYPQSKYCNEAKELILKVYSPANNERKEYQQAINLDVANAYTMFKSKFPMSCYRYDIESRLSHFSTIAFNTEKKIDYTSLKKDYGWNGSYSLSKFDEKSSLVKQTIYLRDGSIEYHYIGDFFIGNMQISGSVAARDKDSIYFLPGSKLTFKIK